jgi:SOS-response transcriptional repressor LexA
MARNRGELDDIQRALIVFFKKNTGGEWLTLREMASAIWVKHPQTILNKLNQLVLKWYFIKNNSWYKLIRESVQSKFEDIIQIPVFGFAQCGHQGKAVIDEYSQEKIPVTLAFIWTSDVQNSFFVRAKWNSMEPKIQDWDLVLIRQQETYDSSDFVFVVHNELPKLKKIIKQKDSFYLESVNRFFDNVELSKYDNTKIIGVVKKIIKSM